MRSTREEQEESEEKRREDIPQEEQILSRTPFTTQCEMTQGQESERENSLVITI